MWCLETPGTRVRRVRESTPLGTRPGHLPVGAARHAAGQARHRVQRRPARGRDHLGGLGEPKSAPLLADVGGRQGQVCFSSIAAAVARSASVRVISA